MSEALAVNVIVVPISTGPVFSTETSGATLFQVAAPDAQVVILFAPVTRTDLPLLPGSFTVVLYVDSICPESALPPETPQVFCVYHW